MMRTGARMVVLQGVRAEVIQKTLYVSSLPTQPLVEDTLETQCEGAKLVCTGMLTVPAAMSHLVPSCSNRIPPTVGQSGWAKQRALLRSRTYCSTRSTALQAASLVDSTTTFPGFEPQLNSRSAQPASRGSSCLTCTSAARLRHRRGVRRRSQTRQPSLTTSFLPSPLAPITQLC